MPLVLSVEKKEEVFVLVKKAFSDFKYFDQLVNDPLRSLIRDSTVHNIDLQFTKTLVERYINVNSYQTKDQKDILDKIRIILFAAAVHLYYLSSPVDVTLFTNIVELQEEYGELFKDLNSELPEDLQELEWLLKFRNYMILAMKLIPAKGNKLFLLRVVERLEGSNNEYITGTGQKPAVSRRVGIYHRDGEVTIVKKAPKTKRLRDEEDVVSSKQLPAAESKKKRKMIEKEPSNPIKIPLSVRKVETEVEPALNMPKSSKSHQPNNLNEINFERIFSDSIIGSGEEIQTKDGDDDSNFFSLS